MKMKKVKNNAKYYTELFSFILGTLYVTLMKNNTCY